MRAGSFRRIAAAMACVTLASACAPTLSELQYNAAYQDCAAGVRNACQALPTLAAQAEAEQQARDSTAAVLVGAALIGAVIGLAASDDDGGRRNHRRDYRRYRD